MDFPLSEGKKSRRCWTHTSAPAHPLKISVVSFWTNEILGACKSSHDLNNVKQCKKDYKS
ncbi:hypothetical protein [Dyadobacter frigoris]|uniref:Uncharacterized protein n=2 Tax=Dyadobacter frigoris TaxID=2576211 RepID=A0A4U6DDG9_9BACT|nr:hypothetical protein [Dyadobacter frigoris]TKT92474.1 hypothetical protein FDK13_10955 [Dyadobacter frigoris]